MGKSNQATRIAAQAIAAELGVKPSRTVRQMQALAAMPRDVAPRKGSEGRRPEPAVTDWVTPMWEGPSSWGYVVAGAPKRVISLPDDNPEYWALVWGETLLGHVPHGFARRVGEAFELRGYGTSKQWVSRVSPVAVVRRWLRMFPSVSRRLTDHLEIKFSGWDTVTVSFLEWDDVAGDVNPTSLEEYGSARSLLEFLTAMDYKAEEEGRRGSDYQ